MTGDAIYPAAEPFADVVCNLAGCGANLYIERHESLAILASTTAHDLRTESHSAWWEVVCSNGHKILVPEKDEESPKFGLCEWHTDYDADEPHDCPLNDMARLRLVAALAPVDNAERAGLGNDGSDD